MILGIVLALAAIAFGFWRAVKKEQAKRDAFVAGYIAGKERAESEVEPPRTREEQLEAAEWQILHDKGLVKESYPEWRRKNAFLKQAMKGN